MHTSFARCLGVCLAGMSLASVLMLGAGYSGRELRVGAESGNDSRFSASHPPASRSDQSVLIRAGQRLFLRNCAPCHGADAHGEEGPDLHHLDWTDDQIATRIRNGKKGQMTAFGKKFSREDLKDIIAYLRTLK